MNSVNDISTTRRTLMQAGLLAATGAGGMLSLAGCASEPAKPVMLEKYPFTDGNLPPKTMVPLNACDCHHHVYDNRFKLAPGIASAPPNATAEDYLLFQKRMGTTRHVVVQPSAYGTDNSCTLDALVKFGKNARGVGVVDTSVTDAELKRLYDGGIRGVRINVPPKIATTIEMIEPLSKRVHQFGLHMQIHICLPLI
jgi:D-galactarolactone isomerase